MEKTDLQIAIDASKAAGSIILDGYRRAHTIDLKKNNSYVTEVDVNSEKEIIRILENESKFKIHSEETRSENIGQGTFWSVDPLDGTTNFIRRLPLFAVSISLISQGQPVVGVVFNPLANELFTGERGKGSFYNGMRMRCSMEKDVIFVNNGYKKEHKEKYAQIISSSTDYSIRKLGTTAYELATVANGGSDAFIAWGDELWDHAAGILLLREAGGIVTDWQGKEWDVHENHVLAGNTISHPILLELLKNL